MGITSLQRALDERKPAHAAIDAGNCLMPFRGVTLLSPDEIRAGFRNEVIPSRETTEQKAAMSSAILEIEESKCGKQTLTNQSGMLIGDSQQIFIPRSRNSVFDGRVVNETPPTRTPTARCSLLSS